MSEQDSNWSRLSKALRESGAVEQPDHDLTPPPGFATRIVARTKADHRADSTGLRLWRQWSLAGAAAAIIACATLFLVKPDHAPQIIPVPSLDELPLPALQAK